MNRRLYGFANRSFGPLRHVSIKTTHRSKISELVIIMPIGENFVNHSTNCLYGIHFFTDHAEKSFNEIHRYFIYLLGISLHANMGRLPSHE